MKKSLTIAVLLISTTLSAHYYNHSNIFDNGFWSNFNHQFQKFDHQIAKLQYKYAQHMQSRQYFDKDSNTYILEVKTQGIDKDNFNIKTINNMLTIKGQQDKNTGNARSSSSFSFTTSVPNDGDTDNIITDFKDGVFKISIPKLASPKSTDRKTP